MRNVRHLLFNFSHINKMSLIITWFANVEQFL